jgi:hypothetical protein
MISYNGYSTPYLFRDAQNNTRLIVGSEQGILFCYDNIDGNLEGAFIMTDDLDELLDTENISSDRGYRTSAVISDISENGHLEMIAGNFSGGLEYFNGSAEVLPGIIQRTLNTGQIKLYPNPADNVIHISVSTGQIQKVTIYSLTGQLVLQQTINSLKETSLNISHILPGIYLTEVYTDTGTYHKKIMVR